jgi:hypothetical protein
LEAIKHRENGEFSAWARIVDNAPYCFNGASQKVGQTWTVLQIKGDTMQIALTTARQYEMDKSREQYAYWTATRWGRSDFSPRAASAGKK